MRFLLSNHRNKSFDGMLMLQLGAIPHIMIYLMPSFFIVFLCLGPGLKQKELYSPPKCHAFNHPVGPRTRFQKYFFLIFLVV